MPILTEGSDYTYLPQLLDHAGGYFSAMVYVRDYLPPYQHTYKEMVQLGITPGRHGSRGPVDRCGFCDARGLGRGRLRGGLRSGWGG